MPGFHPRSPIAFAHRGGRADFPANSLEAFRHAIELGLSVETDAWLTADGAVVLDHNGVKTRWGGLIRRRIHGLARSDVPAMPTLDELLALLGPNTCLSVDIKDDAAAPAILRMLDQHADISERTWLAHRGADESDWRTVASWRDQNAHVHLMDSVKRKRVDRPMAEYAQRAAEYDIDTINMPVRHWDKRAVDDVHAAGLMAFGFRAHASATIAFGLELGLDALFGDHPSRLLKINPPQST
jgi:glycerophosphoryl diester phosphodiesterase